MSETSIGPEEGKFSNDSHGSDGRGNKTLGEQVPGGQPANDPAAKNMPDGPNVGPSPWEKEAAEGKLPKP